MNNKNICKYCKNKNTDNKCKNCTNYNKFEGIKCQNCKNKQEILKKQTCTLTKKIIKLEFYCSNWESNQNTQNPKNKTKTKINNNLPQEFQAYLKSSTEAQHYKRKKEKQYLKEGKTIINAIQQATQDTYNNWKNK